MCKIHLTALSTLLRGTSRQIWTISCRQSSRGHAFNAAVSGTPCTACCTEARPAPASSQASPDGSVPACLPPATAPPHSAQCPAHLLRCPTALAMPDQALPSLCCVLSWERRLLHLRCACQGLCTLPGQTSAMCSTLRHQTAELAPAGLSSRSSPSCTGVAETGVRRVHHTGAGLVHQKVPAQASAPAQAP